LTGAGHGTGGVFAANSELLGAGASAFDAVKQVVQEITRSVSDQTEALLHGLGKDDISATVRNALGPGASGVLEILGGLEDLLGINGDQTNQLAKTMKDVNSSATDIARQGGQHHA
jgi:hypothetical protein